MLFFIPKNKLLAYPTSIVVFTPEKYHMALYEIKIYFFFKKCFSLPFLFIYYKSKQTRGRRAPNRKTIALTRSWRRSNVRVFVGPQSAVLIRSSASRSAQAKARRQKASLKHFSAFGSFRGALAEDLIYSFLSF